jgi:type II secretory pathway component PulM
MTPLAIGLQWVAVKVWGAHWVQDKQRLIFFGILLAVWYAILFFWAPAKRHRRRTEIAHVKAEAMAAALQVAREPTEGES